MNAALFSSRAPSLDAKVGAITLAIGALMAVAPDQVVRSERGEVVIDAVSGTRATRPFFQATVTRCRETGDTTHPRAKEKHDATQSRCLV